MHKNGLCQCFIYNVFELKTAALTCMLHFTDVDVEGCVELNYFTCCWVV